MRKPRQPDPEVHESDYRVPTALGSVAWTVALIVLLARGDRLAEADRWWIWVCVTGIGLGVFAFWYIPRLLDKRAEPREPAAQRSGETADLRDGTDAGAGPQPPDSVPNPGRSAP